MGKTLFDRENLVYATAGAAGSIVAMSCFYPLENIKQRKQLEDEEILNKTALEALIYILKKDGLEALYRGIRPTLTSLGISNFVYFYAFHGLKSVLPKSWQNSSKSDLVISMAAGVLNVVATCPLWVVNSRLKMSNELYYNGLLDGMVHIAKSEGIGALWSGLSASLVLVSNPAIHFTVYEALKRKVTVKSAIAFFVLGALSKTVATTITYPLQLVQTRQRLTKDPKISSIVLLLTIIKRNGPGALYQGLETKMLQTVLSAALMFMTYEKIAQFVFMMLLKNKKNNVNV